MIDTHAPWAFWHDVNAAIVVLGEATEKAPNHLQTREVRAARCAARNLDGGRQEAGRLEHATKRMVALYDAHWNEGPWPGERPLPAEPFDTPQADRDRYTVLLVLAALMHEAPGRLRGATEAAMWIAHYVDRAGLADPPGVKRPLDVAAVQAAAWSGGDVGGALPAPEKETNDDG